MLSENQITKISTELHMALTGITALEAVAILEVTKIALIQSKKSDYDT